MNSFFANDILIVAIVILESGRGMKVKAVYGIVLTLLLTGMLTLTLGANFNMADRRSSDKSTRDTSLRASLNGLERLEADYLSEKISINQYMLYKTWAVFDLGRLSNTEYAFSLEEVQAYRKSGTILLLEIRENWNRLSSETQNQLDFVFERPTDVGGGIDGTQHLLPQLYNTTNFIIHWTNGTDGGNVIDAVPLADANTNGVPDYVENFGVIFEYVRNFEVTIRGFHAPPSDATESNDLNRRNPDGRYDVFIYDMSAYGYSDPEQYPISPSYSYIGVDNDYVGFPTPQLQAMQVTAAHEFFHAIQFYYDCTEEVWWMETTAVYMEDEVYPDVNDNYQYLPYWFEYCDSLGLESTQELHEYGNFIFAKRLSEDLGDIVIRENWEEMETTDGLTAINNVLVSKGSSLLIEFSRFTMANFFLEDMYVDGVDYRANLAGTTTFEGVWLEHQYDASAQPFGYTIIDQGNVNWDAWMDRWATDYITLKLDPTIEDYRIFFDGLDETTNYLVKLVTKKSGVIAENTFSLDAQKDGYMFLSYDTFENVTLIIANAGNTDTADPSWRVIVGPRYLPNILIVDDNDGSGHEERGTSLPEFESVLTAAGYDYVVWNESSMGNPPLDFLTTFKLVIWTCGDYYNWAVDSTDAATLESYFAHGGNILLEGEDIGFNHNGDSFMTKVAHAIFQVDDTKALGLNVTNPTHPVTQGLPTNFTWFTDPPYDDGVNPTNGGSEVIRYTNTSWTAVTVFNGTGTSNGSVVYYAFPIYSLAQTERDTLVINSVRWLLGHDVAITNVTPSKTVVGLGYSLNINVTAVNQGGYTETFNVTVYANITSIALQTVILSSENSTTITFTWNTTGFAYGDYTISAVADTVLGETDTTDNTHINGAVLVTMAGDIDGDGDCDMFDFGAFAQAYATSLGDPKYRSECDFDGDFDVDMFDFGIFAANYGSSI